MIYVDLELKPCKVPSGQEKLDQKLNKSLKANRRGEMMSGLLQGCEGGFGDDDVCPVLSLQLWKLCKVGSQPPRPHLSYWSIAANIDC